MTFTLLVVGCASNGWRSETVVHASLVPDTNPLTGKEAPQRSAGTSQPNGANWANGGSASVCTIVELDGGQLFEIPGTNATAYLTPGASVQLYSASSTDGNKYYSLRVAGVATWEVLAVARPEAQSC